MENKPLSTMTRIEWAAFEMLCEAADRERRSRTKQLSIMIEEWAALRGTPVASETPTSVEIHR